MNNLSVNELTHNANKLITLTQGDRAQNLEQSIKIYEQAIALLNISPISSEDEATLYQNFATAYFYRDEFKPGSGIQFSIAYYKKALTIYDSLYKSNKVASIKLNLAYCYDKLERLGGVDNQALYYYRMTLETVDVVSDPELYVKALQGIGLYFAELEGNNRLKNMQEATEYIRKALNLGKKFLSEDSICRLKYNLGILLLDLANLNDENLDICGLIEEGIEHLSWCLNHTHENLSRYSNILHNIGNAYFIRKSGDRIKNLELSKIFLEKYKIFSM